MRCKIEINKSKCINCMSCVGVCPFTVIINKEGEATVLNKYCIECLHCAATCPVDAISIAGSMASEPEKEYEDKYNVNLKKLIMERRSYRHFTGEKVDHKILDDAFEILKWAPSAKNEHPTRWQIIENPEIINKGREIIHENVRNTRKRREVVSEYTHGNDVVFGENPVVLIAYSVGEHVDAVSDGRIELTTLELILQSQGIGTFWGGYLRRFLNEIESLREVFGLPEDAEIQGTLLAGHPKEEKYIRLPKR